MIIISLSIIIASINHSTHTRAIDYNMKNSPLLEYWESNNRITNNPKIFPIFQTAGRIPLPKPRDARTFDANTLYDRRRRGPARKPVLRLCSSRRLVTFKAAEHAAMQLPCNIVLPPRKRPTSLLSRVFHALQTLSRDALSRESSLVFVLSRLRITIYIDMRSRSIHGFYGDRLNWNSRREKSVCKDECMGTPCMSTRSAGNATIPTRHGNYNTVLPCAAPRSPWILRRILNSRRPRENRRSLDKRATVRHGSLLVLIDHPFLPHNRGWEVKSSGFYPKLSRSAKTLGLGARKTLIYYIGVIFFSVYILEIIIFRIIQYT